jgi:hypothetical protein
LAVIDIFSKFSPVSDLHFCCRAETLERACGEVSYPKTIRVDQSLATWTCGRIPTASSSASPGQESQPTSLYRGSFGSSLFAAHSGRRILRSHLVLEQEHGRIDLETEASLLQASQYLRHILDRHALDRKCFSKIFHIKSCRAGVLRSFRAAS